MQNQRTIPKWLYALTPCTLTATFFVFVLLNSYADLDISESWSSLGTAANILPLIGLIILDAILRLTLKHRFGLIWLIEGVAVIIIFLLLAYISGNI